MLIQNTIYTFEDVKKVYSTYIADNESLKLIEKAYHFAEKKHEGQFRKSGDPYITHCIGVAHILAKLQAGPATICTGFLHDVIEDTNTTKEEVENEFGNEIAVLVEALTKVTRLSDYKNVEFTAENHRKIFVAMAKDIRAIIVKLADRLHNMRTLQFQPKEKQIRISKETLEVYEPIAHRLGLYSIQSELEELSLWYLEREKYLEIEKFRDEYVSHGQDNINTLKEELSAILTKSKIPYRITNRVKSVYSIYNKMYKKHYNYDQIYDILALRIITETEQNCYEILGYVHANFKPVPGRFKDYIAMPKTNMYQSLHTTVFTNSGHVCEIQIRTEKMDETAEGGVAAHWRYKEGTNYNSKKEQEEIENQLHWFKDFVSLSSENEKDDAKDYVDTLSHDIFDANVYVFTPKGNVICLPKDSTPIDFAYRIHSDVGEHLQGAKVNGTLVSISHALQTGDIVEVLTNKNSTPNSEWLNIAKTNFAKNKIRKYLAKINLDYVRDENIKKGRQALIDAARERKIDLDPSKIITKNVLEKFSCPTADDLYVLISGKTINLSNIFDASENVTYYGKKSESQLTDEINSRSFKHKTKDDVLLENGDTILMSLAPCCTPIPGDAIIGFVSTGNGVKVHRIDCPNVTREDVEDRLIPVKWNPHLDNTKEYPVDLELEAYDRPNLLMDTLNVLSSQEAKVLKVKAKLHRNKGTTTISMTVLVKNVEYLNSLIHQISLIKSVYLTHRVNH